MSKQNETIRAYLGRWTISCGPIQQNRFRAAASRFLSLAWSRLERTGIIGGEDDYRNVSEPFTEEPLSPAVLERADRIGNYHAWALGPKNANAVAEDLSSSAKPPNVYLVLETQDCRRTPEQDAEQREREKTTVDKYAEDVRQVRNAGNVILLKRPADARALIVAELDEDKSELVTDYHNHVTRRRVAIGWRTSSKESFPALRRAAAAFPDTAHLGPGKDRHTARLVWDHDSSNAEARAAAFVQTEEPYWVGSLVRGVADWNRTLSADSAAGLGKQVLEASPAPAGLEWKARVESFEHRENWSMGGGNYIKDGGKDDTGWKVKSVPLNDSGGFDYLGGPPLEDGLSPAPAPATAPQEEGI